MDEIVLRAIAKWPNVPSVYNWLSLDRRGNWLVKGERIGNSAVVEFIGRNYAHDAQGRWYFQNGPQRVFVTLAYTPFVYRLTPEPEGALSIHSHTGQRAQAPDAAWIDERGDLLLETELGIGLLVDRDLALALDRLKTPSGAAADDEMLERMADPSGPAEMDLRLPLGKHTLSVARIRSCEVPARFGFVPNPQPAQGEPDC
jgi:hypothetical protein